MQPLFFTQPIQKLEARKGGYHYLVVPADVVRGLSRQKATRLVCTLDERVLLCCGLNHLGNGDFFIILAGRYLKELRKKAGDTVSFRLAAAPDPLGVAVPEVLAVLLEQEPELRQRFETFSDGRKRSLIYAVNRLKDLDKQVQKALAVLRQ